MYTVPYFLSGRANYLPNKWSYSNYQQTRHLKVTYRFYCIILCSICPIISIEASVAPCCTGNPAIFLPRAFQCTQKEQGLRPVLSPLILYTNKPFLHCSFSQQIQVIMQEDGIFKVGKKEEKSV